MQLEPTFHPVLFVSRRRIVDQPYSYRMVLSQKYFCSPLRKRESSLHAFLFVHFWSFCQKSVNLCVEPSVSAILPTDVNAGAGQCCNLSSEHLSHRCTRSATFNQ